MPRPQTLHPTAEQLARFVKFFARTLINDSTRATGRQRIDNAMLLKGESASQPALCPPIEILRSRLLPYGSEAPIAQAPPQELLPKKWAGFPRETKDLVDPTPVREKLNGPKSGESQLEEHWAMGRASLA